MRPTPNATNMHAAGLQAMNLNAQYARPVQPSGKRVDQSTPQSSDDMHLQEKEKSVDADGDERGSASDHSESRKKQKE